MRAIRPVSMRGCSGAWLRDEGFVLAHEARRSRRRSFQTSSSQPPGLRIRDEFG
jgi:hypothetical protein